MDRSGKAILRDELTEKFTKSTAVIIAEYRGLSVEALTLLRRDLRPLEAEFKVSKNRVTKLSVDETGAERFGQLKDSLIGPSALVFIYGDAAPVAKKLLDFEKANELFKVKSGIMEGKVVASEDIKAISLLPSKEVLLGQICGLIQAPARGIACALSATVRNVVQVCAAVKDTKAS